MQHNKLFIHRLFFHNASLTFQQQLSKLSVDTINGHQNNPNLLLVQHLENLVRERGYSPARFDLFECHDIVATSGQ